MTSSFADSEADVNHLSEIADGGAVDISNIDDTSDVLLSHNSNRSQLSLKQNSSTSRATIFSICIIFLALVVIFSISQSTYGPESQSPETPTNNIPQDNTVYGTLGMVSADSPICSEIGKRILEKFNGNAVDAAVATSFCLTLARPHSCGIGGGGVMIIALQNGTRVVIDSREVAPLAANVTMYENSELNSYYGHSAIAIPGEIKGLEYAFNNYGSGNLNWSQIIQPTIDLGNDGIPVDQSLHEAIQAMVSIAENQTGTQFNEWLDLFAPLSGSPPSRRPLALGSKFYWSKLVNTLSKIADQGGDTFYSTVPGSVGADILADLAAAGSIINATDFENYSIRVKEPLVGFYHGKTILTSPPPFSGAIALLAYNILEGFNLPALTNKGTENLGLAYHFITESWKYAYADRMALSDPDFQANVSTIIVPTMLSKAHAAKLREGISSSTTFPVPHYQDLVDLAEPNRVAGTSHYSVVDSSSNVVSTTTTVNLYFGSMWISPTTGVLFNDEMDDFSQPGQTNAFGLPPSVANYIAPGKRPVSSQTPTIFLDGDKPILAIGASGGSRIITATMLASIRHLDFKKSLWESISEPRIHHQLLPDYITTRKDFPYISYLESKGHTISQYPIDEYLSVVQGVSIDSKSLGLELAGVSDPRKGGLPSGY